MFSYATFYTWLKKYGGIKVSEVKRLESLEKENARLKKLLAEAMLDKDACKNQGQSTKKGAFQAVLAGDECA